MVVKRRGANKNPPFFSHEFVIQNHADIVACVAMVFVVGLMFQVTSPLATTFIALHHNVTLPPPPTNPNLPPTILYTSGLKDIPATFFYLLITIVMHQIIQEYVLDKVNRKLHLSKVKHAKFNESGQLLSFYVASLIWAGDIFVRENLTSIPLLWEGYPHATMTFMFKFFFIVQLAYWLHVFPELYFQKIKREDMPPRIQYASLYLMFILLSYVLSYTRLCLVLRVLQYLTDGVFHACRLLSYYQSSNDASAKDSSSSSAGPSSVVLPLFRLHDVLFVLARLGSITLTVLTFWYGLAQAPAELQVVDVKQGIYNTGVVRISAMVAVCLLQAWLMWNFLCFQLRRMREARANAALNTAGGVSVGAKRGKTQQERAKARKEQKPKKSKEDDELPEVDQDTKKGLRQRK